MGWPRQYQQQFGTVLQSTPASLSERLRMEMNGSISEESPATPTGQRRMMETWIVLELCNRGSLQVRAVSVSSSRMWFSLLASHRMPSTRTSDLNLFWKFRSMCRMQLTRERSAHGGRRRKAAQT